MFKFYFTFTRLQRLLQIAFILLSFCFREFFSNPPFRRKRRKRRTTTAQHIRETIEELGPTYVKFGQILADRSDLVSENFRSELKKLQSRAATFDRELAIDIIERSLGDDIENIFASFDSRPLAAASIGQVYSATTMDGERVVVKVQRPFIEKKIKMDIFWLKVLAKRLAKGYPELAAINIVGLIDEFTSNILREIDYTIESSNMRIFSDMFEGSESVKIPKVYDSYTTREVIVMEYIEGVSPGGADALIEKGIDPVATVEIGATAIFKMIFEYGVFHADPHPGNLFIMDGGRVAFIDFGMIGMLRPREINFLADFMIAYQKGDGTALTKVLLELCGIRYFDKQEDLNFAIRQVVMRRSFAHGDDDERAMKISHFSSVMQSSIDILVRFNLQIPSGIFMLMKTVATVEKFAERLAPELDLTPYVMPYAKELVLRRAKENNIFSNLGTTLKDYLRLLKSLPNDISELVVKLKEGRIRHDIKLSDEALFVKTSRQVSLRLAYAIILVGLYLGSIFLISLSPDHRLGNFILYSTTILIVFLLVRWLFKGRRF